MDLSGKKSTGRYTLKEVLGQGSTATVHRAWDSFQDRDVAIKTHDAASLDAPEGIELQRKMFFREAQAAGRLKHPGITEVYDALLDDETYALVMEYVEGGRTLAEHCQVDKLLPVERVVEIIHSCASAMEFAHRHGVVHRDIKPSNILLTGDGQVKLTDFGIAFLPESESTDFHTILGTPMYIAPEQVRDEEVTGQADIYSLGVVTFELLTGRRLFNADNIPALMHKVLNAPLPKAGDFREGIPEVLERILARMLARDTSKRYRHARDVAADLSLVFDLMKAPPTEVPDLDKFRLARKLDFFRRFPDAQVWEFIHASVWRRFNAGQSILRAGDIDRSLYIMASGEAVARKDGRPLNALAAGDCFGEIGYLTRGKRTADVVAQTEVLLIKVKASMLDRASRDCQLLFYRRFLHTTIERLVRISDDYTIGGD